MAAQDGGGFRHWLRGLPTGVGGPASKTGTMRYWSRGLPATALEVSGPEAILLVVANASQGHTAGAVVLVVDTSLVVSSAEHAHSAQAPTLTQVHALVVAEAGHLHSVQAPALAQAHSLVVAGAEHGQSVEAVLLTQAHLLVMAGALHAQSVSAVDLAQQVIWRQAYGLLVNVDREVDDLTVAICEAVAATVDIDTAWAAEVEL